MAKRKETPVETVEAKPVPPAPTVIIVKHPWTEDGARAKGLKCPRCGCPQFSDGHNVRNTIRIEGAVRRYRQCRACQKVWCTLER